MASLEWMIRMNICLIQIFKLVLTSIIVLAVYTSMSSNKSRDYALKITMVKKIHYGMFIAALFTIAKRWKQP